MNEFWFFHPEKDLIKNSLIALDEEECHHLTAVLRYEVGKEVFITNGNGQIGHSTIEKINKRQVLIKINHVEKVNPPEIKLHLACGLLKHRENMEWLVEKATELGASKITFVQTEHSERSKLNLERLEKIVISAVKQSKNAFKPQLNYEKSFINFIEKGDSEYKLKLLAWCGATENFTLKVSKESNTLFFIGPEGDFSQEEINLAAGKGFANVSLGDLRLRSETAAIYLLSYLKAISSL